MREKARQLTREHVKYKSVDLNNNVFAFKTNVAEEIASLKLDLHCHYCLDIIPAECLCHWG